MTEKILRKLGIESLNEMQRTAFDAISSQKSDVIILSPTGSGKTLAYMLPLVQLLDGDSDYRGVQAIVVTPGRELALQSATIMKNMGCGLRAMACYGGRTAMQEHQAMRELKPLVIFGTPGRLNDHIGKNNINPYNVRFLIIDEFDKCLEMGFLDEMSRLVKQLPGVRYRVLLSATNAVDIPRFVRMHNAVTLDFTQPDSQVSDRVTLHAVQSPVKDKLDTLSRLLRMFGDTSSIVFLNYRDSVERTADYLRGQGFSVSAFHGGMEQKMREDAMYKFSNGSANIFVSTDLASRGLDIPDISNIIHYHLPQSEDGYIHRVGRTARWDAAGKAFFILGPDEHIPDFVEGTTQPFEIDEELPAPALPRMVTLYIGKGKKDKISKGDIVGFLCKQGGLDAGDIGRIDVNDRYSYVAISRPRLDDVLLRIKGEKIKGVKTIVELVK